MPDGFVYIHNAGNQFGVIYIGHKCDRKCNIYHMNMNTGIVKPAHTQCID